MARPRIAIEVGQRFGRLLVLGIFPGEYGHRECICRCDCGNAHKLTASNLVKDGVTSCGCYLRELTPEQSPAWRGWVSPNLTHGHTRGHTRGLRKTPEYRAWRHAINRCTNRNSPSFPWYGGRGITVCPEWRHSFEAFIQAMGPRPSALHSIDRIDNNGPYAPGNCRWATREQQMGNRRISRYITYDGVTLNLAEWARRGGMTPSTLSTRLRKPHWSLTKALTFPLRKMKTFKRSLRHAASADGTICR